MALSSFLVHHSSCWGDRRLKEISFMNEVIRVQKTLMTVSIVKSLDVGRSFFLLFSSSWGVVGVSIFFSHVRRSVD
jgi:hypothetical protein